MPRSDAPALVPLRPARWPASSIPPARLRPQGGQEATTMGVIIIREMVGRSPNSWSDAARRAVETAAKTVRNIQTVEVVKSTAEVRDGEIVEYRVEVKIGFEYEG